MYDYMRDSKGRFIKGHKEGLGKKRPLDVIERMRPTMFKKGDYPWNLGKKLSEESRKKMSISASKQKPWLRGVKKSEEHCNKISQSKIGKYRGEESPHWIKDRSQLAKHQERNDFAYINWRKGVIIRDGYKCKVNNSYCSNEIYVHHIVPWRIDETLRYEVSNGIVLCKYHHPRKRKEEIRLIEYFKNLINS